ncbi:MAG: site-specific integrase [Alphaproteobacteria bacterium]|nr:MAG: site-specific integrase [Alphaproteobacteria bacterium]
MALRFTRLTRPAIRRLKPGEKITEHGITAERLPDGDTRYSVNVMVDGQRIHRVIGRQSEGVTRTQGEEFIGKQRAEAREGRLSLPKGRKLHLTFAAAADLYLSKLKEIGGKDYVNNEQHLRLHLVPYFGKMRLDRISVFTLQKFQNHCRQKGLSDPTVNRILATYRRMARRLAQWKVIPAPLPMVKLDAERNRRTYVISENEEQRLLDAALADSNSYIWLFIKLGLATGLRHSEMLAARFDKFDSTRRRLRVKTKGSRWRNQPLTRGITAILQRERDMAEDTGGWIFPSKRTRSGHVESMDEPFARCIAAAGMDTRVVTPHTMRHTAITRLAETGADIVTIQEFSGHETVAMVMRYAHAQDRAVDRALDKMEEGTVAEHPRSRKTHNS